MRIKAETTSCGKAALKIGASSVVTGTLIVIASVVYYGLGLSTRPSALENINSGTWSEEVKSKIQSTYIYLLFSFYICLVSAFVVFNDPILSGIFSSPPMVLADFLVQTVVQNGRIFARLDTQGFCSVQRLAWIAYCSFLGGIASPAFLLGIKTTRFSIHLTFLIVFALIILSLIAPAGKYVAWKNALSVSESLVILASIGAALFPLTTTPGAIFFTFSFYGGLIFYPTNFLFHSQQAQMKASQETPENIYCAISMSIPMLLDAISIFSRIVVMVPSAEIYH